MNGLERERHAELVVEETMDSDKNSGIDREEMLASEYQRDNAASMLQARSYSLDALPTATTEGGVDRTCFLCGTTPASCRCYECTNATFCDECYEVYHTHPRRSGHRKKGSEGTYEGRGTIRRTAVHGQMPERSEDKDRPQSAGAWTCESCTYQNQSENVNCKMCTELPRERARVKGETSAMTSNCSSMRSSMTSLASTVIFEDEISFHPDSTDSTNRHCKTCTFINSSDARFCKMCRNEMPVDVRRASSSTPTKRTTRGGATNKNTKRSKTANSNGRKWNTLDPKVYGNPKVGRLLEFDKKGEGQWKCDRCNYHNSAKARQCNSCNKSSSKHSSLPANLHSLSGRLSLGCGPVDEKQIRMIQGEYDIATREEATRALLMIQGGISTSEAIKVIKASDAGEFRNEERDAGVVTNVGKIRGERCSKDLQDGNSLDASRRHSSTALDDRGSLKEPSNRVDEKQFIDSVIERDKVAKTVPKRQPNNEETTVNNAQGLNPYELLSQQKVQELPPCRCMHSCAQGVTTQVVESTHLTENGCSKDEQEESVTNAVTAIVEFHKKGEFAADNGETPRPDPTSKNDENEKLDFAESRQEHHLETMAEAESNNSPNNSTEITNDDNCPIKEDSSGPSTSTEICPDKDSEPSHLVPDAVVEIASKVENVPADSPIEANVTFTNQNGSDCNKMNASATIKTSVRGDGVSPKGSQNSVKEGKSEALSSSVKTDNRNKETNLKKQKSSRTNNIVDNRPSPVPRESTTGSRNSRRRRNSKRQSTSSSRGIDDTESISSRKSKQSSKSVLSPRQKSHSKFKNCIIL